VVDPILHQHLEDQQLSAQFYSLRWLMLLVSQEFSIDNVIRIWDTLLSDHDRFNFVNYICVAMVALKRDFLLQGDFSDCMEAL